MNNIKEQLNQEREKNLYRAIAELHNGDNNNAKVSYLAALEDDRLLELLFDDTTDDFLTELFDRVEKMLYDATHKA